MQNDWEINWEDYYKILQIDPSAEAEVIEGAYKKLAYKYHADKNPAASAEERMKKINRAYEILYKDPAKKRQYDIAWQRKMSQSGASANNYTAAKPEPEVDKKNILFTNVLFGKKQSASFIVNNLGGPCKKIKIFPSQPNSWVRIARFASLSPAERLPMQVEIEAVGERWGTSYFETIIVRLDNEEIQVKVQLQTRPLSVWVVLIVTKRLIVKIINKIRIIISFLSSLRWPIRKKYIFYLLVILLLIWAANSQYYEKFKIYIDRVYGELQATNCNFTRDLHEGLSGSDVLCLQKYLNSSGYKIALSGLGSLGNETDYFSPLMVKAVSAWQIANRVSPASGYFGAISRAKYNEKQKSSGNNGITAGSSKSQSTNIPATKSAESADKLTPKETTKSETKKTSFIVAGTIVDRHGDPVPANYWLADNQDQQYGVGSAGGIVFSIPKAYSNGSFKTVAVADGEYTLHISDNNYFGAYREFGQKVKIAGADVNLGLVVLPWSWVTGTVVDRESNPIEAYYWLTDDQDMLYGNSSTKVFSNGSFKTVAVADGEYTLHLEASGYITLVKQVIVAGQDVSVGQLILEPKSAASPPN